MMITKRYELLSDVLNMIMLFFLAVIIEWTGAVAMEQAFTSEIPVITGILIILLYLARRYVKNLFVYIMIHLGLIIALFFIPLTVMAAIELLSFIIILSVADFVFWTDHTLQGFVHFHVAWCVLFLFAYAYGSYKSVLELTSASYIMGIFYFGIYFLRLYFDNGKKFSLDKQMSEEVPLQQMYAQNLKMIFPIVLIFVLGMFFLQSKTLSNLLMGVIGFLIEAVVRVVNWITSLLPQAYSSPQAAVELPADLFVQADPPARWLQILLQIIEMIISIAFITALVFFMLRGIIRFIKKNVLRDMGDDKTLDYLDMREKREWISPSETKQHKKRFEKVSNVERIRRIYRKRIQDLTRHGYIVNHADTPVERAHDVLISQNTDISNMTAIYESVRYGSKPNVSDEMVRQIKKGL